MQSLAAEYNVLFVGEECRVAPYRSAWVDGATEAEVRGFTAHGVPMGRAADHFGSLLLAASRLEDHAAEDESEVLETLFAEYILPWCGEFWAKLKRMPPRRSGVRWPR